MGWVVTKDGNDRDWATALPGTSPERSRAARAAGEFTGVTMGINAGDCGIATLKLGGLDLVAIRGAPFEAPSSRIGRARRTLARRRAFPLFGRERLAAPLTALQVVLEALLLFNRKLAV